MKETARERPKMFGWCVREREKEVDIKMEELSNSKSPEQSCLQVWRGALNENVDYLIRVSEIPEILRNMILGASI